MTRFRSRWACVAFTVAVSTGLYQCSSASSGTTLGNQADAGDGGAESGLDRDSGSARDSETGDVREAASEAEAEAALPPPPALLPPTFTPAGPPPNGVQLEPGSTIAINAPAGAPADVQLYYSLIGSVPTPTNGTLYSGAPLQINFPASSMETVTAIAHDPSGTYSDSAPNQAIYTETLPSCCGLPPVTFSQQSSTQNNDFVLGLSNSPGANICYSVDGVTVPTCTDSGICATPALTYNQPLQINGTMAPNPATGSVTVTAIACGPGVGSSQPISQTFILRVAAPTMSLGGNAVPPTTGVSNAPWPTGTAGLAPTIQSFTHDSVVVSDPVVLRYTFGSTWPTCDGGGVGIPNPTTFGSAAAPAVAPLQSTRQIYQVIGCKHGYLPSPVATFPVNVQLNAPALPSAASPYYYDLDLTGIPGAAGTGIDDSANAGAPGEILCATTDGTPATCTAGAGGAPSCGGTGSSPTTLPIRKTGTTVNVVACGPGVTASSPAPVTYTLQLAPPFLASTDPLGIGGPGWDWASTGVPVLVMSIPGGASSGPSGYPYADGSVWNVSQIEDDVTPCTGAAGPEPTGGCGPEVYFAADYYCWSLTKTAACGPGGTCTSGTAQSVTVAGSSAAVIPAGAGAGVTPGSTFSLVACDLDAAGEAVFAPSAPTNVLFQ